MKFFSKSKMLQVFLLSVVALAIVGCSSNSSKPDDPKVDLVKETHRAASNLASDFKTTSKKPLLAVSFADVDNLRSSSTLGRTLGEQFASSMTQLGMPMIEIKMRSSLFMEAGTGELILSRELRALAAVHDAQAVVLGTYAIGGSNIYINARIVRTEDNIVLASENYALPINKDLRGMIKTRR